VTVRVLLLVDDEPDIPLALCRHAFSRTDLQCVVARTGAEALLLAKQHRPAVVLLDVLLPDLSGLEVFEQLRALDARMPVVFITGTQSADTAIEAMKRGAYDYLFKPLHVSHLQDVVERALEVSRMACFPAVPNTMEESHLGSADGIVGRCAAMQEVYKAIGRVACQEVPVLILGESGTGKELVARSIYQHSRRAGGPFMALNCAAIPESLLESELFGHEKGAFTGAERQRIGKFEQCKGGTLFLDEVGDMTLGAQAKVLRAVQEKSFERVGGNETVRTDVRLIAATNRNLEDMMAAGRFRPDLFYRLAGYSIRLPPLRERGADLPLLVKYYLQRFSRELGREVTEVAPEAMKLLCRYHWPGNVRELQSVLRQALLESHGSVLIPSFLPKVLREAANQPARIPAGQATPWLRLHQLINERLAAGTQNLYDEVLQEMERELFVRLLEFTGGRQFQAAKILGIGRPRLRKRLSDLGITIRHSVHDDLSEDS
jgi:two-component system nitrogen regulation response regulator GlnG